MENAPPDAFWATGFLFLALSGWFLGACLAILIAAPVTKKNRGVMPNRY